MTTRLATQADLQDVLTIQHATATALSAIGVDPWTTERAQSIIENGTRERGTFRLVVCELGLPRSRTIAGFMMTKRYRFPPPEPDGTELTIQLIASRIENTPVRDRLRLRIVALQCFKELVAYCHANGLTWRAFTLDDAGDRFAINELIGARNGIASGIGVEIIERNGVPWRVVRSNDPVLAPALVSWPADTNLEKV